MTQTDTENTVSYAEMQTNVVAHRAAAAYPGLQAPKDVDNLLNSLRDLVFLRSLDSDSIAEYLVILNSYLNFLLDQEFDLKWKIVYCKTNLDFIIGRELKNSAGFTFEEKTLDIMANHTVANRFAKEKAKLEILVLSTKALSDNLRNLIDAVRQMGWARKRQI